MGVVWVMRKICTVFIVLLYMVSLSVQPANAEIVNSTSKSDKTSNRLIIKYKNSNDEIKLNLDISNGIKSIKKIDDKLSVIEANNDSDKKKLYDNLKVNSKIESVEEDKTLKNQEVPNDTDYNQQWYVPNINLPKVWDSNITSKKNVIVAVIDSGINSKHEDLQGNILDGGYDFYDNSIDTSDDNGHGTNVAGVIVAEENNAKGIAGIDSKVPVKILPLKTADSDGYSYLSDMISAVDYAISKKVDVINLSMGSTEYSDIENQEIQKAISSGIVVVAAAGNNGNSSYMYPASYDNVISVGATDENNNIASFSDYNDKVILSAPGTNIETTDKDGGYACVSGTSFSTPIVSALAAMIKCVRPDLAPKDIKNVLENNALDLGIMGKDNSFGYGKVDAYKTISNVLEPKSIQILQNNISINVNGTSNLKTLINPDNAIDKNVIWSSGDNSIASVDQNGTVKGVKSGNTNIIAKTEQGNLTSEILVNVTDPNVLGVEYDAHVENIGWQNNMYNGEMSGTVGQGLRMEALKINLQNVLEGAKIKYQVHVENLGWQDWKYDGDVAGTTGKGLRIEGARIVLENAPGYSVAYQAQVEKQGLQDWVYDGQLAGTVGQNLRMEAINIKIVKTSDAPCGVTLSAHVETVGWQQPVRDNELAGTVGQSLRMEALKMNLVDAPIGAKIKYQVHVQNIGWQDWKYDGDLSGTTGEGLRIEGVRIILENAPGYSVTYQAQVQNIGWQNWVKNGELSGTTGRGLRMESIKVKIIKDN